MSFFRKIFTSKYASVGVSVLLLFLGFVAGWKGGQYRLEQNFFLQAIREADIKYKYIDPLLACNYAPQTVFTELDAMKQDIQNFTTSQKNIDIASAYYRDINSGRWASVNENEQYGPASLLKVPIMIAYFKQAETDPSLLSRKFYYSGHEYKKDNLANPLLPQLAKDRMYSVAELIRAMIVLSDNEAKDILLNNINLPIVNEVFSDLGIQVPPASGGEYYISAKTYSLFFRTLYNATYLTRGSSEKALALLSEADFTDGLVKGTPAAVAIAHKYGERGIYNGSVLQKIELHDCGIVYYPSHPYLLCVMTRGMNPADLEHIIQGISGIVYKEQSQLYP